MACCFSTLLLSCFQYFLDKELFNCLCIVVHIAQYALVSLGLSLSSHFWYWIIYMLTSHVFHPRNEFLHSMTLTSYMLLFHPYLPHVLSISTIYMPSKYRITSQMAWKLRKSHLLFFIYSKTQCHYFLTMWM